MHKLVCGRMVVFPVLTKGLCCWIRCDEVSLRKYVCGQWDLNPPPQLGSAVLKSYLISGHRYGEVLL